MTPRKIIVFIVFYAVIVIAIVLSRLFLQERYGYVLPSYKSQTIMPDSTNEKVHE